MVNIILVLLAIALTFAGNYAAVTCDYEKAPATTIVLAWFFSIVLSICLVGTAAARMLSHGSLMVGAVAFITAGSIAVLLNKIVFIVLGIAFMNKPPRNR